MLSSLCSIQTFHLMYPVHQVADWWITSVSKHGLILAGYKLLSITLKEVSDPEHCIQWICYLYGLTFTKMGTKHVLPDKQKAALTHLALHGTRSIQDQMFTNQRIICELQHHANTQWMLYSVRPAPSWLKMLQSNHIFSFYRHLLVGHKFIVTLHMK